MKYEKPNVALVASAVEAVKQQSKSDRPLIDVAFQGDTNGAYESDE